MEIEEAPPCAICLDNGPGSRQALPCGHSFHATCVVDWFLRGRLVCPCCRSSFDDSDSDSVGSEDTDIVIDQHRALARLPAAPDRPYWTAFGRPGCTPLYRSPDVLKWIVARILERSRAPAAPAALKRLFAQKRAQRERLAEVRSAMKDFNKEKGTWAVLRSKRVRLTSDLYRLRSECAHADHTILDKCRGHAAIRRYLVSKQLREPSWW